MDLWEDVTGVARPKIKLPPRVMHVLAHISSFTLTSFFPKVQQRFTPDAVRILRMHRRADISKARRLLGYNPQVSVPEGVRRFWEWDVAVNS